MDWASSEWKQELSAVAIQKVNALEEKVEKLQKERQQLNLQNDCLKIALDKEKRRVDKEKQNLAEIQRELQTLSEACKDIEDRHQKLQNEIQNRDSRIGSLEVLLAQYKNENCKLQQLVNDVKDLRPLREAALAKREQKALVNKESNESISSENEVYASLKEKIAEQEALIEELKKKVNCIPSNEILIHGDTPFTTPVKKIISTSVTDSPIFNKNNSSSVWDGFGSTPARENKDTALRQNADSMGLDTRDEKLVSLQTRLKQLCQELECQRHNFEASKTAMEVKFKEKENMLKSDLKYQTQINADLDKELKETKNRFQQELTQAGKKIDVLTLQLKKAEQAKEHLEKDFKSVESKMSSSEMLLKAKEEELKDLQKVKNACDVAQQSLQTLKAKLPELDRKMKSLEAENSSYAEKNRAIQMQLDGSNNLVQEKEMELIKLRKECQILTTDSKTSQDQVKTLNEKILDLQIEFSTLQSQLKETLSNESALKEQIQQILKEKKELSSEVLAKTNALQTLKIQIDEQIQKSLSLEKDMENKSIEYIELNKKLEDHENASKIQLNTLEEKMLSSQNEYSSLSTQYQESLSSNSVLQEQINSLMMEKNDLGTQVEALTKAAHGLKSHMDLLHGKKLSLEEEIENKNKEHQKLSEKLADLEKSQEDQLKILYDEMLATQSEYTSLRTKLKNSESSEASFTLKIGVLENENSALSEQVTNLNNSIQRLQCEIDELNKNNNSLKMDMESKVKECTELAEKLVVTEKELKVAIQELEEKLMAVRSECRMHQNADLQKNLANVTDQKVMLESRLELVEKKKNELHDNLVAEISKTRFLECSIQELKKSAASLDEELTVKSSSFKEFSDQIQKSKEEYENKIHNLEEDISSLNVELNELKDKLHLSESRELSLKEKLTDLEKEKNDLLIKLEAGSDRCSNLNARCDELEGKNCTLKDDLAQETSRKLEIEQLLTASKDEYQIKYRDIEQQLLNSKKDYKALEARSLEYSLHEKHLKEKISGLEKVEHQLRESLEKANQEIKHFELKSEELTKMTNSLKVELSTKTSQMSELVDLLESSKEEFEAEIEDLRKRSSANRGDGLDKVEQFDCLQEKFNQLEKVESSNDTDNRLRICCEDLNKKVTELEEEVSNKASKILELNQHIALLKAGSETHIKDLNIMLTASQEEVSSMQNQMKENASSETSLYVKLELLEEEKGHLLKSLETETIKSQSFETSVQELKERLLVLEEEVSHKSSEIIDLNKELDSSIQEIKELTASLSASNAELNSLQNQHQQSIVMETLLKGNLEVLEGEKKHFLDSLAFATEKTQILESDNKELRSKISELELTSSSSKFINLTQQMVSVEEDLKTKIERANLPLAEFSVSQKQLDDFNAIEKSLNEKISLLENDKETLSNNLTSEVEKVQKSESCVQELKCKVEKLEQELLEKSSKITEINQCRESYVVTIKELLSSYLNVEMETSDLLKKVEECLLNESSLYERHYHTQKLNNEPSTNSIAETSKNCHTETHNANRKHEIPLKADISALETKHESVVKELKNSLSDCQLKLTDAQTKILEINGKENSLKEKVELLEKKKRELNENLIAEINKTRHLESFVQTMKKNVSLLEDESNSKQLEIITYQKSSSIQEKTIKELEEQISGLKLELSEIQERFKNGTVINKALEEKLDLLEKKKQELNENLVAEISKARSMDALNLELKKNITSLKEELSLKSSAIEDLSVLLENTKDEYELKIQQLENKLSGLQNDYLTLQEEHKDCTTSALTLKEKLQSKEEEIAKVEEQLEEECFKSNNFDASIGKLTQAISELEKEVTVKSNQLNEANNQLDSLKSQFETKLRDIELLNLKKDKALEDRCLEYSLNEEHLKEKISELEKVEHQLRESLEKANQEIKQLELKSEELTKMTNSLKVELSTKTSQINELVDLLESSKKEFEITIEEQEGNISGLKLELSEIQEKVKNGSVINKALEEKLDLLEKKKQELNENLVAEISKTRSMDALNLELKKNITSLKEELSLKSSAIEDLSVLLENTKDEYELKIQQLENNLSGLQNDYSNLQEEHKDCTTSALTLKEKLQSKEEEIAKVEGQLEEECFKSNNLDASIGKLTQAIQELEKEVAVKSNQLNEANNQLDSLKSQFETKLGDIELLNLKRDKALEDRCLEYSLNEEHLKEKISELEKVEHQLRGSLEKANQEIKQFELKSEELTNSLKVELSTKTSQMNELVDLLESSKEEFKITLKEQEENISGLKLELSEIQEKVKNGSVINKALEEKLDLLEKKKQELNENLVAEISKTRSMDALNLELKKNITSLKEELSLKSSAIEDLSVLLENTKDEYELKIQDLENKLSEIKEIKIQPILEKEDKDHITLVKQENDRLQFELLGIEELKKENLALKTQCASLEKQLKDFSQNKILLTQTLSLLEGKQRQLVSTLETKNSEIISLENSINLLNEEIESLQDEMLFERKNCIDSENTNQKLRDKITSLETELVVLNLSLNVCSQNESLMKEKCVELTGEGHLLVDMKHTLEEKKGSDLFLKTKLASFQELYSLLFKKIKEAEEEKGVVEITCKIIELKPVVEKVGTELKKVLDTQHLLPESDVEGDHFLELMQLKDTLENKVKSLEDKLVAAHTRCAVLEDELIQRTEIEIDAEEKLLRIDDKYDETLKEEVHVLKSDLEDLNSSFSCLDDEVKHKLLEADVTEKLGPLKEYQKNVWKLQGWTSKARSKIQLLETKLRASLLREELLGIELSSIKTLLCEETSKVNMCESGFGDLKIILWHLQDIIASEDSFCLKYAGTNPKMDFGFSEPVIPNVDFKSTTIEDDCFSLHTFSVNLTGEALALEKDLVITLERCQFLLQKSLVKEETLITILKKFSLLRRKLNQCQILKRLMLSINQLLKSSTTDLHQQLSNSVFSKSSTYAVLKFLYLSSCASNDLMLTLSQSLKRSSIALSHHSTFIENRLTIHDSSLHIPIIHSSKYILFIHQITEKLMKKHSNVLRSFSLDLLFSGSCDQTWENVKQNILNTDIQHIPHILNLIMSICEKISFIFDKKHKYGAENHSTPLVFGLNEYLLSKLVVFLVSQINSSHNNTELKKFALATDKLQKSNIILEQALITEKAKHQLLNSTIEEIENDLSDTFQEKERYKKLAVSAGHLLSYLKDQLADCSSFPTASVKIESIDESCFCEGCVESTVGVSELDHERISPSNCLLWLKRCLDSTSLLQAEVITLREYRADNEQSVKNLESTSEKVFELESKNSTLSEEVEKYSSLCAQLQDKNMSLIENSKEASCNIENLKSELEIQRRKADDLTESMQKKVEFISELKLKITELSLKVNELEAIHGSCDNRIEKLSVAVENYLSEIGSKEEEVVSLRNVTDELKRDIEKAHLKHDEYENKIQLLNSSLSKFEEEKNVIEELQCKVKSLKKSNESLNLTIEQIEDELQNVCTEKNQLTEKVDSLLKENISMKEIAQKYDSEKERAIELLSKLKRMESEKEESNSIVIGLKSKVEILEKDIAVLKSVQRQQEHVIFDKSKTLKEGEKTVKKLQQAIIELEEKLSLVLEKDVETETGLDLKLALEEANKQVRELKVSEQKYLDKLSEVESQRNSLISKINESRKEIQKISSKVAELEESENALKMENAELQNKLKNDISLKEELLEKEKSWMKLSAEYEDVLVELNALKSINDALIAEKKVVSQKEKQLETEMVIAKKDILQVQSLLKKIQEDCNALSTENESLKIKLALEDSKPPKEEEFKTVLLEFTRWNADLLRMILGEVKKYSWYPHLSPLECNLENAIAYCNQSVENFDCSEKNVVLNIHHDLQKFFIALSKSHEEQPQLVIQAKLIQDVVKKVSQFCSSRGTNCQAETTFFDNAYEGECSGPVEEMQNAFDSLTDSFNALKNIIWEKEELIKALETKLKNAINKEVAASDMKDGKKEKNKYEWKFNLLKMNLTRLEQDFNEVKRKNKELETLVEKLQKEKETKDSNTTSWDLSVGQSKEFNNVLIQNSELESRIKCLEEEKEACISTFEKEKKEMESLIETLQEELKRQEVECDWLHSRYKGAKNSFYTLHTRFEETEEKLKESEKLIESLQETITELQKKSKNRNDISPCKGKENFLGERKHL